jgi:hypothetical protein
MFRARPRVILGESAKWVGVLARRGITALGILLALSAPARSQSIREDFPLPNGLVYALAQDSGTCTWAGPSRASGPRAFFGAALSPVTGEVVQLPKLDGPVGAAATDGRGGWFIIGGFNHVEGLSRHGMAHVESDGTVAE